MLIENLISILPLSRRARVGGKGHLCHLGTTNGRIRFKSISQSAFSSHIINQWNDYT